jgi:hypothetical protein
MRTYDCEAGLTARRGDSSVVSIQFGGCDGKISNCLSVVAGWNYMVRRYRAAPRF